MTGFCSRCGGQGYHEDDCGKLRPASGEDLAIYRSIAANYNASKWTAAETAPPASGKYLVVQQKYQGAPRFMWVRTFSGAGWFEAKEHEYGPVTHWMHLPSWPDAAPNV